MKKILLRFVAVLLLVFIVLSQDLKSEGYYDNALNNTVFIGAENRVGTGFIYKEYIITAAHVLDTSQGAVIGFYDGSQDLALVKKIDYNLDIVVLDTISVLVGAGLQPATDVVLGEESYMIGHGSFLFALSKSIVSGVGGIGFYTDDRVFPGSSGSPVFNENMQVIGMALGTDIVSWNKSNIPMHTKCISIDVIDAFID